MIKRLQLAFFLNWQLVKGKINIHNASVSLLTFYRPYMHNHTGVLVILIRPLLRLRVDGGCLAIVSPDSIIGFNGLNLTVDFFLQKKSLAHLNFF